jgi:outer membrane protein OmpA-like peptidoglycan-associated protein
MFNNIQQKTKLFSLLFFSLMAFPPLEARAAETPTMAIEEAKFAVEQARKAGAEQKAADDLAAAKSWLVQAEKEYEERKSFLSRTRRMVSSDKAKEEEIIYLATMAKIKGQTAEAKAKRDGVSAELKGTQGDIANYKSTLEILMKNVAAAEKAREVQAKAEAERKELGQARQKADELEETKKKEIKNAQKRAWELDALKQKELQEARAREAQRATERGKELVEARLKAEQLAFQKEKEEAAMKAREEKLAAEKQKMAVLQQKAAALEREKAMLIEAGKIPQTIVKAGDKEIVVTLLAINLFTPQNELHDSGKTLLDQVGKYLKKFSPPKITVRGHTDSVGKPDINQAISDKRAQKVREFLVVYEDIPPARIMAEGVGPSQPVATNSTEAGRALNRRVEIVVDTTP